MLRAVLVLAAIGCSGKTEQAPPPPPVPADASVIDGITAIGGFDPASGMHLDDDTPNGKPTGKKPARQGPPIGILLKSDPPGATVFVDGQSYGVTPKYWHGVADGSEHEFAFTRPKYALARYRFVPIASGTLHATLQHVGGPEPDAGLEPQIAPTFAPDAAPPAIDAAVVAPPPTVLTPDAALPAAIDAAAPRAPAIDAAPVIPPAGPAP